MFDVRSIIVALLRDPEVASAIRDAIGSAPRDELLDRAKVEAEYPIKFRIVTDAGKRGEIAIDRAGRKPLVRRSVLEAWIAARPAKPGIAKATDKRSEARAAVSRAAARVGSK